MTPETRFTLAEAHRHFAQSINGRVWELLAKDPRSSKENDELLYAAHACAYHWLYAGSLVNQQRGEWLISRVHVVLGQAAEALRHAGRCFELTQTGKQEVKDFDIAYAYEGLARARALLQNHDEAIKFYQLANEAGAVIADDEDRSIFMGDFTSGDWFGLPVGQ